MFKPRRTLIASVCAAALLFTGSPAALGAKSRARPPKGGGDLERKRDDAKRKEDQVRHDLDLAHASESELEKHLAQIAADLVARQADAADAKSDAEEAAVSVVKITADIAALKVELAHRKDIFNRRAVKAYMAGQGRPLDSPTATARLVHEPDS